MSLIIDANMMASAIQDKHHKLDRYAYMQLSPEQKGIVVYSKLESLGDLADLRHTTPPWVEQYTAIDEGQLGYRSLSTQTEGEVEPTQGAAVHLGLIFTFHGSPSGTRALDPNSYQIMTESQAAIQEETFNQRLPRYTQWDFRLHEVIVTDGPERRARLMESNEEQRARTEEKYLRGQDALLQKQTQVFERLIQMIQNNGGQAVITPDTLKEITQEQSTIREIQPEQVAALELLKATNDEYDREKAAASAAASVAGDAGFDVKPVSRRR